MKTKFYQPKRWENTWDETLGNEQKLQMILAILCTFHVVWQKWIRKLQKKKSVRFLYGEMKLNNKRTATCANSNISDDLQIGLVSTSIVLWHPNKRLYCYIKAYSHQEWFHMVFSSRPLEALPAEKPYHCCKHWLWKYCCCPVKTGEIQEISTPTQSF